MVRPLIHDKMFARLHEFYPATVTIQRIGEEQRKTMGGFENQWVNLPDHENLGCRLAPSGGQEVKLPDQTYVVSTHTIAITGWYPGIDEKDRAIIMGDTFDILLVESDGQGESTRLAAEIVT